MKKNKFELKDKVYFGFLSVMLLSLFLPWVKIPIMGSFSALNNWRGLVGLLGLIGIGATYFYNERYSYLASLSIIGGISLYAISSLFKIAFVPIDLGIFGEINLLSFVGVGLYLFIIGGVGTTIKSFIELKKFKDKSLKFAIIGGVVVFALLILSMNLGTFSNNNDNQVDLEGLSDLGGLFDSSDSEAVSCIEQAKGCVMDKLVEQGYVDGVNCKYEDNPVCEPTERYNAEIYAYQDCREEGIGELSC